MKRHDETKIQGFFRLKNRTRLQKDFQKELLIYKCQVNLLLERIKNSKCELRFD